MVVVYQYTRKKFAKIPQNTQNSSKYTQNYTQVYFIPEIQRKWFTEYPYLSCNIPYTRFKKPLYTVYPKTLADPEQLNTNKKTTRVFTPVSPNRSLLSSANYTQYNLWSCRVLLDKSVHYSETSKRHECSGKNCYCMITIILSWSLEFVCFRRLSRTAYNVIEFLL